MEEKEKAIEKYSRAKASSYYEAERYIQKDSLVPLSNPNIFFSKFSHKRALQRILRG